MKRLIVLILSIFSRCSVSMGFFFGSSGECSCAPRCPVYTPCAAPPLCYTSYADCGIASSYPLYTTPTVQDCCSTCAIPCRTKIVKQIFTKKRQKRQDEPENVNDTEAATTLSPDSEAPYDPRCNSERLRNIIIMSKGRDITIIKRNIQLLAEKQFQNKYNVICSADGDFSYITNTEEHCQEFVNGNTCYLFKQAKRLVFS